MPTASFARLVSTLCFCFVAAFTLIALPSSAQAQYPERRVDLVLGWGAGGVTDISARAFAPLLAKHLGATVVVRNKPGGAGAIGTTFVAQQPADGYTLLFSAETPASFRVLGTNDLSFHDFMPITMISGSEKVIVVDAASPYQTMQDLVDDIKARPGKVRFSYTGPGASGHIQGLLMRDRGGLDFSMTPFGSGKDCLLAVLSGQVDFTSPNVGTVIDYIRSGKVRVLANFDKKPSAYVPEAPPISESIPALTPWLPLDYPNCLLIKKGTPPEVAQKIAAAAEAALNDPQWLEFVQNNWYTNFGQIKGQAVLEFWDRWASIVCWILYDSGVAKNDPAQFGIPRLEAGAPQD